MIPCISTFREEVKAGVTKILGNYTDIQPYQVFNILQSVSLEVYEALANEEAKRKMEVHNEI